MSENVIQQAADILKQMQQMRPELNCQPALSVLGFAKGKGDAVKLLHEAADKLVASGRAGNRANAVWLMVNDPRFKTKYKAIVEAAAAESPAAAEGVKPAKIPTAKGQVMSKLDAITKAAEGGDVEAYQTYIKAVQANTGVLKKASSSAVERDRLEKAASGGDAGSYQAYTRAIRATI